MYFLCKHRNGGFFSVVLFEPGGSPANLLYGGVDGKHLAQKPSVVARQQAVHDFGLQ